VENVLLSFLFQLRIGYVVRDKTRFPRSIALIGMRNIRGYTARKRPDTESMGTSSPFDVIKKALTLLNFTSDEVKGFYTQHTEATCQVFSEEALERAFYLSERLPWLVNALARQVVEKILLYDYITGLTAEHLDTAADNLMKSRNTHIDSLLARLHEPKVKRIIEPMLALSEDSALMPKAGEDGGVLDDDLQYCLGLGLVKIEQGLRPANPICARAIERYKNSNIP
jgi:hypothetical protein